MVRLQAGDIEADLSTSAVFQANTPHVNTQNGVLKSAESLANSAKSRGSIGRVDDALDNWHLMKHSTSKEVQGALYGVIKECQHWLNKKLESKSKSTTTRSGKVTELRDLAWRNLKMLNPALAKMETSKAAFLAQNGRVPLNMPTKSLHGTYVHERNLYVKHEKKQTFSASLLHERHEQVGTRAIKKDFEQLGQKDYEKISQLYREEGTKLDMRYHNKVARSEFLLDVDTDGLLRKQDGKFFDGGIYAEIYVMDQYGNLFSTVYTKKHGQLNHSSFLAGKEVICAGCICVSDGKLKCIDTMSGHYKPTLENLSNAILVLGRQGAIHKYTLAGIRETDGNMVFVSAIDFAALPDPNNYGTLWKHPKPKFDWPK